MSPEIAVACTRKDLPGTKQFAVAVVKAGGAVMHRLGLSETVLVFPEHRAFLERGPLTEVVGQLRRAAPEKRPVAEVTSFEAAIEFAVAASTSSRPRNSPCRDRRPASTDGHRERSAAILFPRNQYSAGEQEEDGVTD